MRSAEFEEREFEAPLYNRLGQGNHLVWSPGQVFEGHVGLDFSIFTHETLVFRLNGFSTSLPGTMLSRYQWPRRWFLRQRVNRMPGFRLNLFIQAKRSEWGVRTPKKLRGHRLSNPFWRFIMEKHQQAALEKISEKLGRRALVVYASPAFHTHRDLQKHTRQGTIVDATTFPSAAKLHGHTAWYYDKPGASGIANPDFQEIIEPPLYERIQSLLRESPHTGDNPETQIWKQEIRNLASDIQEALKSPELDENSRLATFFDLTAEIERDYRGLEYSEVIIPYFTVLAFCESFVVDWYVVGGSSPSLSQGVK